MFKINDEEKKALNEEAERINSQAATPVAETNVPEEVEEPKAEVATEAAEEPTETEEEQPKKGADARIRELNSKAKAAEEKARSLEEKIAELTAPTRTEPGFTPQTGQQQTFNPAEPLIAPGEEIDAQELNRRIEARDQRLLAQSDSRNELRLRQSEAVSRINRESSEVIRLFPELDPSSEDFNRELSDSITEATEAYVKASPYDASVKGFVAKLMKPYKKAVEKQVGKDGENLAKQVSQSALRPTNVHNPEKSAKEKSIAELEKELGIIQS